MIFCSEFDFWVIDEKQIIQMLNSEQKFVDSSKQNADFITGACLGMNSDRIDNFKWETHTIACMGE